MGAMALASKGPELPAASQIARLAAQVGVDQYQAPQALSAAYVRNKVAEKSAGPKKNTSVPSTSHIEATCSIAATLSISGTTRT